MLDVHKLTAGTTAFKRPDQALGNNDGGFREVTASLDAVYVG